MPAISIIIPAYNMEKYISNTVRSLKRQTFRDIEVIIVNDGSTDNTGEITIKELSNAPFSWKIKNQVNQGVSAARNSGIREAKGDYIHFLDADDYVQGTFMEKMHRKAREGDYDMVFCGYSKVLLDGREIQRRKPFHHYSREIFGGKSVLKSFLQRDIYINMGNAIYRREFLNENNIYFTHGLKNLEDIEFIFRALYKAKTVACEPEVLAFRVIRADSSSKNIDLHEQLDNILRVFEELKEFLGKNGGDDEVNALLEAYIGTYLRWNVELFFVRGTYRTGILKKGHLISFIKKSQAKTFKEKIEKNLFLYSPKLYKLIYLYMFSSSKRRLI